MNENAKVVNVKKIEWILRIALFGIFLGHGVLALAQALIPFYDRRHEWNFWSFGRKFACIDRRY